MILLSSNFVLISFQKMYICLKMLFQKKKPIIKLILLANKEKKYLEIIKINITKLFT